MEHRRTFEFSFLNITRKLCVEFDITISKSEYNWDNKISFFFTGEWNQMQSFLYLLDKKYKLFSSLNSTEDSNVFTTS